MKLPKRELPVYKIKLPYSKKEVEYRPYTIKEERIIDLAAQSDSDEEKFEAVKQVIDNCSNVEAAGLHPADLEYLYIKIYAAANGADVEITHTIPSASCGLPDEKKSECVGTFPGSFNIDKDVKVINLDSVDKFSKKAKGGGRIVELVDGISLQLDIKSVNKEDVEAVIYDMLIAIITGDEVIAKEETTLEEFKDFINSFTVKELVNLRGFFDAPAQCEVKVSAKCSKCGKNFGSTQQGILSFLI